MKVVLDTNALVYAAKNKIDLFGLLKGCEVIIPNLVLKELQELAVKARSATDRKAALLATRILERSEFRAVRLSGRTDSAIERFARREHASVLTNDAALKKKLKGAKVKVLHIRQKKYVEEWC